MVSSVTREPAALMSSLAPLGRARRAGDQRGLGLRVGADVGKSCRLARAPARSASSGPLRQLRRHDAHGLPLLRALERPQGVRRVLQPARDDQAPTDACVPASGARTACASRRAPRPEHERDQRLQQQHRPRKVGHAQHQHRRGSEQAAQHDAGRQLPQLRQADIAPHLAVDAREQSGPPHSRRGTTGWPSARGG